MAEPAKASDNTTVRKSEATNMDWLSWSLIVGGIVAAAMVFIVAWKTEASGWLWYCSVFAALIALAVAIGTYFQGINSAASDKQANEAIDIAKDSIIALEKAVLPRNIEQMESAKALSGFKEIHVLLSHVDVRDAEHTAGQIERLLKSAGWTVERDPKRRISGSGIGVLANVGNSPEETKVRAAATELVNQLKKHSKVNANRAVAKTLLPVNTIAVLVGPVPASLDETGFRLLQGRAKRLTGE